MKKATKEELLKLGFKEKEHKKEKRLSLKLNKGKDKFYHFLRWYEDEPDKFYIDEILIGKVKTISEKDRFYHFLRWYEDGPDKFYIDKVSIGEIKTISEKDFLVNTNNLATNAIKHYKQILEKLENAN